jgi:threonyl-tRNA synthetase
LSDIQVTFPDKSTKIFSSGVTPLQIAASISRNLAEKCTVAEVNGKMIDLTTPLQSDATLKLHTTDTAEGMEVFWHTSTHVMAQAVKRLWPEAKLEDGPPTEAGFFYDILFPNPISQDDFAKIEAEVTKILKEDYTTQRMEMSREEARALFQKKGEEFKLPIIDSVPEGDVISTYSQGEFVDLCRGPHLPRIGMIRAFKIMSVAGAFYKGDENNVQLQRLRGISFPSKKQLDEYLHMLEEAKKRDHRRLGQELELFYLTPKVGGGLPLWLPNGTILRETLVEFLRDEQVKQGYFPVVTPHIGNIDLYKTSGHYPYYKESQFAPITMEDGEQFLLKPMNCPHHIQIYASRPRSYRELPLRLAEFGTVYRYEQSGELTGLTRVRSFTVDDSHLFVRDDQVLEEMCRVIGLIQHVFNTLGFKDFRTRLSFRDDKTEKYGGDLQLWERAQKDLQEAADKMNLNYFVGIGEAAFYGPKIDFMIKDVLGRTWQLGTVQLDYVLPERFKLEYTGADGQKHRPIMIHRAPFGSLERFIGILIEHFAGNFPVWLSPVQVFLLTIGEGHRPYAQRLAERLRKNGVRVHVDDRNEKISYKIREAEVKKVPYILVIGDKEMEMQTVSVRRHGRGDQGSMALDTFIETVLDKIISKSLD